MKIKDLKLSIKNIKIPAALEPYKQYWWLALIALVLITIMLVNLVVGLFKTDVPDAPPTPPIVETAETLSPPSVFYHFDKYFIFESIEGADEYRVTLNNNTEYIYTTNVIDLYEIAPLLGPDFVITIVATDTTGTHKDSEPAVYHSVENTPSSLLSNSPYTLRPQFSSEELALIYKMSNEGRIYRDDYLNISISLFDSVYVLSCEKWGTTDHVVYKYYSADYNDIVAGWHIELYNDKDYEHNLSPYDKPISVVFNDEVTDIPAFAQLLITKNESATNAISLGVLTFDDVINNCELLALSILSNDGVILMSPNGVEVAIYPYIDGVQILYVSYNDEDTQDLLEFVYITNEAMTCINEDQGVEMIEAPGWYYADYSSPCDAPTVFLDYNTYSDLPYLSDLIPLFAYHTHIFDQQIETNNYLQEYHSCPNHSYYYYSCMCGERGSNVFKSQQIFHHYENNRCTGCDGIKGGLYVPGTNCTLQIASWDELINMGYIFIYNGEVYTIVGRQSGSTPPEEYLVGDLVFPAGVGVTSIANSFEYPNSEGLGDFAYCNGLTNVHFLEGLLVISSDSFSGCSNLKSIYLPVSLERIDERAFENCTSLTTINYAGSMEQWRSTTKGDNWLNNTAVKEIHCKDGTLLVE